jgi:ribonuclease D
VKHSENIRALSNQHNETLSEAICRYMDELGEAHLPGALAQFGTTPRDSAALLELRTAIDRCLGWENSEQEAIADYPARIEQIANWISRAKGLLHVANFGDNADRRAWRAELLGEDVP